MMKRAAVTFDPSVISPGALVEAVRDKRLRGGAPGFERRRHRGAGSTGPRPGGRVPLPAPQGDRAAAPPRCSTMLLSMPLMGGAVASRRRDGRSVHALGDDKAHAAASRRDAVALRLDPAVLSLGACSPLHARGDGLGRTPLLRARLGRRAAPRRRHEHARSRSAPARRFVYSLVATIAPAAFTRARRRAGRLLRGGRSSSSRSSWPAMRSRRAPSTQTTAALRALATLQPKVGARHARRPGDRRAARRRAARRRRARAAGRADARRRRRRAGHERGRRVDADRRVHARAKSSRATASSAATINGTGAFRYRATTLGADSVLAQIVRLMRDAQGTRAPIQALADRISAVFVPVVIAPGGR